MKLFPQDEKLQDIINTLDNIKQGQEQPVIHLMLDYIQQAQDQNIKNTMKEHAGALLNLL